ncbi:hypothetical protein [Leptolyngbya sp. DQ-M1]
MRVLELLLKKYEQDQFVCHLKTFATELTRLAFLHDNDYSASTLRLI